MAIGKYALAGLLLAVSSSGLAAVTVIGTSSARLCYEAAESPLSPSNRDLTFCEEALDQSALSEADTVATYVNRGILRLRRNDVAGSIADFDRAIALNPRQPEAYLNKGAALIRADDPAGALRLFTVALDHDTQRPALAHYGRAVAHEALGNVSNAYRDYRRASELDPDWEDPRTELRRFTVVQR